MRKNTQHQVLVTTKSLGLFTIEHGEMAKECQYELKDTKIVYILLRQPFYIQVSNVSGEQVRRFKYLKVAQCVPSLDDVDAIDFNSKKFFNLDVQDKYSSLWCLRLASLE